MVKFLRNQDIIITPFTVAKEQTINSVLNDLIIANEGDDLFPLYSPIKQCNDNVSGSCIQESVSGYLAISQFEDSIDFEIGKYVSPSSVFYPSGSVNWSKESNPINLDGTYQRQVYNTIQKMYYNNYNNAYNIFGFDEYDNSKASLNLDNEFSMFKLRINQIGDKIRPNSVVINNQTGDVIANVIDDGNYNLKLLGTHFINKYELISDSYDLTTLIDICGVGAYLSNPTNTRLCCESLPQPSAPPEILSLETAAAIVDQSFSYTIEATHTPTSYGATGLPSGLYINTTDGVISGIVTTAGGHTITLSATNAVGTGTKTLNLTVNINGVAPVIYSNLNSECKFGVRFTYTIRAYNFPTSFSVLSGLPSGNFSFNNGIITGIPDQSNVNAGNIIITIRATNQYGFDERVLNLTVLAIVQCSDQIENGETMPSPYYTDRAINLGSDIGTVNLDYNMKFGHPNAHVPDRFQLYYNGNVVIDTEWVANTSTSELIAALENIQQNTDIGFAGTIITPGYGTKQFIKTSSSPYNATLRVYSPLENSGWDAKIKCPVS